MPGWLNESFATVLWLVPAAPEREVLHELVVRFAKECDAPVFEPHLTLGRGTPALLDQIQSARLRLRVERVAQTEQYTKTLFLRLKESGVLRALRRSCTCDPEEAYDPHVSLLYANLPETRRLALARSIVMPFESITFDSVALIRSPNPIATRTDVEAWRTVRARRLS